MKPLGLMLTAAAVACAAGGSNETDGSSEAASAPMRAEETGSQRSPEPAPAGGARGEPGAGGNAADVPIAGTGGPAFDAPADGADQCGASRYQWLIGRPRSAIPARPSGATWRIACTSCPITEDYSPARLNIFFDSETDRIETVRCG